MRTFGRILEVQERSPGKWYIRFSHEDESNETSDYVKISNQELPSDDEIMFHITRALELIGAQPDFIPDQSEGNI